jgi:hypothetical protein
MADSVGASLAPVVGLRRVRRLAPAAVDLLTTRASRLTFSSQLGRHNPSPQSFVGASVL